MKLVKLSALFIGAALSIAAVGSAALSNISLERNATGQVLVDTDDNVAIQIKNISKYNGLVKNGADGKVSFDLNEAINNNSKNGFNTDALFTIGSASEGVIQIKNNSDVRVTVSMTNDFNNNAVTLMPVNSSSNTIEVGQAGEFYFTINTKDQSALNTLKAVLRVEGN